MNRSEIVLFTLTRAPEDHPRRTVRPPSPRALASVCQQPQALAACRCPPGWRILNAWAPNHATPFSALPSGPRLTAPPLPARKPTGLPAKRGTSACSAIAARRNHRRRSAMPSMPHTFISKSAARLRHAPDRRARHRATAKVHAIHELERYMRCKDCSQVRGYPFKRSHLIALRATKVSASDPPSTWWPGIGDGKSQD